MSLLHNNLLILKNKENKEKLKEILIEHPFDILEIYFLLP